MPDAPPLTETLDAVITDMHASREGIGDAGQRIDIDVFAISEPSGRLIEDVVAAVGPSATIEVGFASGLSTLHICRGRSRAGTLSTGSSHVIDPKQTSHWKNIGRHAISRAGLSEHVIVHEQTAHQVLPKLLESGLRAQFAFIDGWHMMDYLMVEAFYCDLMLEPGGIIAIHDMQMPALQHFASYWVTNRPYKPVSLRDGQLVAEPWAEKQTGRSTYDQAIPMFLDHLSNYADCICMFLQKTGEDQRRWDEFHDYVGH